VTQTVRRGKAAQIDPIDVPKGWKYVQWKVENPDELAVFLEPFVVRMRRAPGDHMLIQSPGGMNLQLSPGDCLVIKPATIDCPNEQLGVIHSPMAKHHRESESIILH